MEKKAACRGLKLKFTGLFTLQLILSLIHHCRLKKVKNVDPRRCRWCWYCYYSIIALSIVVLIYATVSSAGLQCLLKALVLNLQIS
ncbi:MAG: hypothetical protein IPM74_11485 [Crocinitomicaceae bacterium]|nr:hypothetical protein [Crocinitomicaceae bacterium]